MITYIVCFFGGLRSPFWWSVYRRGVVSFCEGLWPCWNDNMQWLNQSIFQIFAESTPNQGAHISPLELPPLIILRNSLYAYPPIHSTSQHKDVTSSSTFRHPSTHASEDLQPLAATQKRHVANKYECSPLEFITYHRTLTCSVEHLWL